MDSIETWWQDARFSMRTWWRHPGISAIIVLTLGLGIGVNSGMFSVMNAVLLRPLPYPDANRLVLIKGSLLSEGKSEATLVSMPDFLELRQLSHAFETISAYNQEEADFTGAGDPLRLKGARVTADLLPMLGIRPILGRAFSSQEEKSGQSQVVLIGHALWKNHYGADPAILGKTIRLSNFTGLGPPSQACTVIGVLPPGFEFPSVGADKSEFWLPLVLDTSVAKNRSDPWMVWVLGRLRRDVSLARASAEMKTISQRLETTYPESNKGWGVDLGMLHDHLVKNARPALLILMTAVALVLLIACANVANLLLSRSLDRQKEMAIRAALGASRLRVIRLLLVESTSLALLGGLTGFLLVFLSFKLILSLLPTDMPRLEEIRLDGSVFWFTLVLSTLTGVVFGLAPAIQLSNRRDLNPAMGCHSGTISLRGPFSLQGLLLVTQIALAVVLLVGAGLLVQSLVRLRTVPLGFRPENVLTLGIQLPELRYLEEPRQLAFFDAAINQIAALPGVVSVGAVRELPIGNNRSVVSVVIEGRSAGKPTDKPWAGPLAISPRYFQTLGIQIVKGREFNEQDQKGTMEVAIINEAMAKRFWPGEDPVGKRFKWANSPWSWFTVVGMVKDSRQVGEALKRFPEFYRPMTQFPNRSMTIAVKTVRNPKELITPCCRQIWNVDRELPIQQVRTLEQILEKGVVRPRLYARLVSTFAILAIIMTAVGVYSLMSFMVSRRTREIGIRMALGAGRNSVLKLVLGQGLTLTLAGVGFGLIGAFALTRYAATLFFGVKASDPVTFAMVAVLLVGSSVAACLAPALRAMRIHPMTALRYE